MEDILMNPVIRRYIEAWVIILNPWLLLFEQPAVEVPGTQELRRARGWFIPGDPLPE